MPRSIPALTAAVLLVACASGGSRTDGAAAIAPVVDRDDLVGCLWEEVGEVRAEDRTSGTLGDEEAGMRRALGRSAVARGANAVTDFKSMRMTRVAGAGGSTPPRGGLRRATGLAIRIQGGHCAAIAGPG